MSIYGSCDGDDQYSKSMLKRLSCRHRECERLVYANHSVVRLVYRCSCTFRAPHVYFLLPQCYPTSIGAHALFAHHTCIFINHSVIRPVSVFMHLSRTTSVFVNHSVIRPVSVLMHFSRTTRVYLLTTVLSDQYRCSCTFREPQVYLNHSVIRPV